MGIAERKEKQKLEIKKLILDASMKLFVDEGFENVSIRKIADLIEYSPTTVYLYFKDKDEILFSLHDIGFQKLQEHNQSLATIKNPLLRLHKMGENYLDFGMDNPEYYDLMFIQRAPMNALMAMESCEWKSGDAAINVLKATLAECMEKNLIEKDDVNAVAMAIWGMVHGLVSLSIRDRLEKLVPLDEIKPTMIKSLHWIINAIDLSNRPT
ncbi:MAG: TetR/AcrR family transcriptional regulator [Gemmatimonadaceae bacterium]|nr:TetR/AcrR family transcriptional regulator [Chitinophagaceae bacterium]